MDKMDRMDGKRQPAAFLQEITMAECSSQSSVCGFHHVALRAADFDASIAFYTEVLGFRAGTAWGEGNGRAIMLDAGNGNFIEVFAGGTPGPKPEGALLHLALSANDVDGTFARARDAGAPVVMEPATVNVDSKPKPMSIRLAFFKGPDGEVIELFKLAG